MRPTRQTFDTLDQLRIAVERDEYPGEMYNRIDSPNGEGSLGVWGWNTPTANTAITSQPGPPPRMAFFSFADQTVDCFFTTQPIYLTPGQWIKAQYVEYPPVATGGPHRTRFVFFNAAGDVVGDAPYSPYWYELDNPVTRTRGPSQAPSGTVYARLIFECYSIFRPNPAEPPGPDNLPGLPVTGHRFDFGTVRAAVADTADALATITGALTGYPTIDITPDAGEVSIVRETLPLNVGTLTARLASDDLDPAFTDALRPGRRIKAATAGGEDLFAGRIRPVRSDYAAQRPTPGARGVITITAMDVVTALAGTRCSAGYSETDDLRTILDRAITPLPWSVNGNGSQRIGFGPQAIDAGATLLDQVLRTCDTTHAYAWVDRAGALRINDRYLMPTEPVDTLTEDDYSSDLAPAFDSERAVNSVTVNNMVDGESVTHGPYTNFASVRRWGELTATYTVIDVPSPAAFALEVLATNANPQVTVETVTLPLATPDQVERFARLELCDLLEVTCEDPALDLAVRIAGIEHRIAGDRWHAVLRLVAADRIPLPSI